MRKVNKKREIINNKQTKQNEVRNAEVPVYLLFIRCESSRVSEWVQEY